MPDADTSPSARVAVFGEALFDCFPGGEEVLGGAPFNVAWHLQGLGAAPLLVSRVGADRHGRDILARMRAWGMACEGVGIDDARPTGRVEVSIAGGQPSFSIPPGQAWDALDAERAGALAARWRGSVLYHGTLALRGASTRAALRAWRRALDAPVFLDLNLRPPWDDGEAIEEALGGARWVKLNADELARVAGRPCDDEEGCLDAAETLQERWPCEVVLVTRGDRDALARDRAGGTFRAAVGPIEGFVDSVGAGDGFSAMAIRELLAGAPLDRLLARAVAFAGRVCTLRGATTDDRSLYRVAEGNGEP